MVSSMALTGWINQRKAYITRSKVESGCIEIKRFCEICHAHSEMAELMHWCRT